MPHYARLRYAFAATFAIAAIEIDDGCHYAAMMPRLRLMSCYYATHAVYTYAYLLLC